MNSAKKSLANRKSRWPSSGIIPARYTIMERAEPLTAEQRAEFARWRQQEWLKRLAARLTPEQFRELRHLLSKKPKKNKGGQVKWTRSAYVVLLTSYWAARKGGLSAEEAKQERATVHHIEPEEIAKRITRARKILSPSDLSDWARPALGRGAKP